MTSTDSSRSQKDKLFTYRLKRNQEKTPEPFSSKSFDETKLFFVIQEHHATRLHYDFRLQIGEVMPSWAIPKGIQDDPKVKRLAMKTEDHPLDYRKFHRVIPKGEYGAGEVIIWDEGAYIPEIEVSKGIRKKVEDMQEGKKVMLEGIEKGEVKFYLLGKKVKGSFALVKTSGFPPGKTNAWLLIKHK